MVDAFEYGNEPSDFIKCGEFLDCLQTSASQEGLCTMEYVSKHESSTHLGKKGTTNY